MYKYIIAVLVLVITQKQSAGQSIPNGDFKKWDEYGCPDSWSCNNDADCKGKVSKADKVNGGARLTVVHCFDPQKEDRSNNVNMSYDDLTAKILKNKKVKISFDYSYTPVGNDVAYVKIDADLEASENSINGSFEYNGNSDGNLKAGTNQHIECYLNFSNKGKQYNAPDDITATSIRTTFGISAAAGTADVHKGSTLIINHVKFTME